MKNYYYYGFAHKYGANIDVQGAPNGDGGSLHVFASKKARDEWVDRGPEYVGANGARVAYPASKVRAHVKDNCGYEAGNMATRELVDRALKDGIVRDETSYTY